MLVLIRAYSISFRFFPFLVFYFFVCPLCFLANTVKVDYVSYLHSGE